MISYLCPLLLNDLGVLHALEAAHGKKISAQNVLDFIEKPDPGNIMLAERVLQWLVCNTCC